MSTIIWSVGQLFLPYPKEIRAAVNGNVIPSCLCQISWCLKEHHCVANRISPCNALEVIEWGCAANTMKPVTLFTPKLKEWSISNFPYILTRNITLHSMKNLAFHSLIRWKMIILPSLTTSLNTLLLTLSLPRVINFKFLLQPHQEYYITQCKEFGFS